MMTRVHFEAIAYLIRSELEASATLCDAGAVAQCHRLAHRLASEFRAFNPHFDKNRFLQACGLDVS